MMSLPNELQEDVNGTKQHTMDTLEFFMMVGKLKRVVRTGWMNHEVKQPESVADHMYRMSMMALMLDSEESKVDKNRCIKIAIVHDLAECIVGDITPYEGISKEEKHRREEEAMVHLKTLVHNENVAEEIMSLWMEYNDQKTPEAIVVKDIDRFEMILQAFEYEVDEKRGSQLQSFFNGTRGQFRHSKVKEWVSCLHERRERFLSDSSRKDDDRKSVQ